MMPLSCRILYTPKTVFCFLGAGKDLSFPAFFMDKKRRGIPNGYPSRWHTGSEADFSDSQEEASRLPYSSGALLPPCPQPAEVLLHSGQIPW